MIDEIKEIKGFKIVPNKFRSSTIFDVKEYKDNDFKVELLQTDEMNLDDYNVGDEVEVFGLGDEGLVYFVTKITNKDGKFLNIEYPEKIKNIQRREYSRVKFDGILKLKDFPGATAEAVDVSAGGIRLFSSQDLNVDETYAVTLELKNNVTITCDLEILKSFKTQDNNFDIRARFLNLKSVDRIALIQYSFQILLEDENK